MKKFKYLAVVFLLPMLVFSQDWGGLKPNGIWDHWSVNANAGVTSYFGDLSYNDKNIKGKLTFESGPAYGLLITKHFSKLFSISGQFFYGEFKGGNNKNLTFKTNLAEYSMQANFDFVRLLFPDRSPKFGLEGHAGLGQFLFRATTYELKNDTETSYVHETGVPEFIYFYGGGAHYHLGESFSITLDLTLHHAMNDKLDNLVKNDNFDYYSHLSIGVTYYLNSFKTVPMKNKARLAHTGIREN